MRIVTFFGAALFIAIHAVAATPKFDAGMQSYRDNHCRQALGQFADSAKSGEVSADRPLYEGVCLLRTGELPSAALELKSYTEDHASDARGWYWLARVQFARKEFTDARASVQRSIQLDGKSGDTYKALGEIDLELKDNDAAYHAWLTAHDLSPNDPQIDYYLGRLFFEADFLKEGAYWFRETLRLAPHHFATMTYLGLCAENVGSEDTAIQLYKRAIAESKLQNAPFAWAFLSYGKLMRKRGDEQTALAVLEEAEKLCPEAHALTVLGQILADQHQEERAESVLRRAIDLDPALPDAHYRLSLLFRAEGKQELADIEEKRYLSARETEKRNAPIQAIRR